jgi:hypothetical protein
MTRAEVIETSPGLKLPCSVVCGYRLIGGDDHSVGQPANRSGSSDLVLHAQCNGVGRTMLCLRLGARDTESPITVTLSGAQSAPYGVVSLALNTLDSVDP